MTCNTPIGFLKNARPSESRRRSSFEDQHARTPPSAFPFLHITMSKSRWQSGRSHTPEPPMEAKPPLGVNDSRCQPGRKNPGIPRFCPMDRAVAYSPAGRWETTRANPVFRDWTGPCQGPITICGWFSFSVDPWLRSHIPARIRRHSRVVNGVVTIRREYG
jgi:hypothetical protein